MKMIRLFLTLAILLTAVAAFAENIALTVLQTTDIHGSPDVAKIVWQIRAERASGTNPLVIDCGDLTQGSYEVIFDQGRSMFDALNAAGYDVFVPGNHDFDYGDAVFFNSQKRFHGAVLAANLQSPDTVNFASWKMFERRGVKIAVIGILPPYLDLWIGKALLKNSRVLPPQETLAKIMPQIRAAKPDVIILAIHLGEFASGRLNKSGETASIASLISPYPEISLVLGGHTHEDVFGKALPNGTWYVQAPHHGRGIARIQIQYDKDKKHIDDISSELIITESLTAAEDMPESWIANQKTAEKGKNDVIANLPQDLTLGPMIGKDIPCPMAKFCAQAMAEYAHVPMAFSTTYSKYEKRGGRITEYDLFRLIPYENYVTILELHPSEIIAILNEQMNLKKPHNFLAEYGPFSIVYDGDKKQVSGMIRKEKDGVSLHYFADPKKCFKTTETSSSRLVLSPDPHLDNVTVRVAFGSYAVSGGGGRYPVLKKLAEMPGRVREDHTELMMRDVFREFLKNHAAA